MTALLDASPIVDDATRREFIAMIGAAGLLTACTPAAAPAPPAAATRRFTDRLNRAVDVPVDPQRVVVLDPSRAISDVVALGLVPVGATTSPANRGSGFPPFLGTAAEEITAVGAIGQADLERIAALAPDLILFATVYQDDLSIDTLSAIAPVVAYERPQFGLLEPLRFFGEALGRQDRAARLKREFVDLIAARRTELGLDGRRVAVVNISADDTTKVEVLGPAVGFSPVLSLLGATYAPQQFATADFTDVSVELVGTEFADTDLLIGLTYVSDPADAVQAFTNSDPWRAVPAVAAGKVAYLDGQQAFVNYGLAGISAALDDLAGQLR